MNPRLRSVISAAARFGLAAVWLVSGWIKLSDPVTTKHAVEAYQLLPTLGAINAVALILPVLEIILGILLAAGVLLRPVGVVSAVIFVGFIAAIISAWARGLTIDCGCFGGGGVNESVNATTYLLEIGRDLIFIAAAVITAAWPFYRFSVDRLVLHR